MLHIKKITFSLTVLLISLASTIVSGEPSPAERDHIVIGLVPSESMQSLLKKSS